MSRVTEIYYARLRTFGRFENETFGCRVAVVDDNVEAAMEAARQFVNGCHAERQAIEHLRDQRNALLQDLSELRREKARLQKEERCG